MLAQHWDVATSSDDEAPPHGGIVPHRGASESLEDRARGDSPRTSADDLCFGPVVPHTDSLEALLRSRSQKVPVVARQTDFDALSPGSYSSSILSTVAKATVAGANRASVCEPLLQYLSTFSSTVTVPGRKVLATITGKQSHSHVAEKLASVVAAQFFGSRFFL